MKLYLLACFICLSITGLSQRFSSEVFHEGFVVTSDKDTLKGDLKYDLEANVLTLVTTGKTKSFSSHKVFYFEIFDKILNNYRQFYSIPYHVNFDYKIPVFFEVVYEGKLSLLRREQTVVQTVNTSSAYWGGGNIRQNVIQYSYYFLDEKGKITFFTGRKKDLLQFMSKKQIEIKQFIKQNRLDTDESADLVRITAFYNSI
ncbi:MAG: hypothetical protein AAGC64_00620 [Bacteroidota bacterium]